MSAPFMEMAAHVSQGIPATLALAVASGVLGTLLGLGLAAARLSDIRLIGTAATAYVAAVRGTPLLVQLFLVYYGLPQFDPVRGGAAWILLHDPMTTAIIVFALNVAAYFSEILRGAILAVPPGEIEAGRAYGLHGGLLHRRVIGPIAARIAIPGYGNEWIGLVKATSLASTVTVMELTGTASDIGATTFRPVAAFATAGLFYLAITGALTWFLGRIERRFTRHLAPAEVL